jgi:hypothetical protein
MHPFGLVHLAERRRAQGDNLVTSLKAKSLAKTEAEIQNSCFVGVGVKVMRLASALHIHCLALHQKSSSSSIPTINPICPDLCPMGRRS